MAVRNKNRKRTRRKFSIPYPGALPGVLIFAAAIALVYLWVCGRCESLGNEIGALEARRNDLSQQLNLERSRWAKNETLEGILKGLARWDIQMQLPDPEQVVLVRRERLLEGGGLDLGQEQYALILQNNYEQL